MSENTEPLNLFDYERIAAERLPRLSYDYYASGAHDELSLHENRAAFDRIQLLPRVLVDVSKRDSSTQILGRRHTLPLLVAPMAFAKMAHPEGEMAMARASAASGITMTLSTLATSKLEDVASVTEASLWFQLYVFRDRGITRSLIERAETAGYQALVVTVDVPLAGTRERDVRNRFTLPEGLFAENLAGTDLRSLPAGSDSGLTLYIDSMLDQSLTWSDLEWIRSITRLPVLVKGILRPDDAVLAVKHGASGVIVSNHGGRQLDTAVSPITALPDVVAAIDGRAEVLMDGGVRRGTDIVKAIALGARAVLVGRPILWGMAVDGQHGVQEIIEVLRRELDLAMALSGCPTIEDITPDLLR